MIICHCNKITSNDIEEAVGCLKRACQSSGLCIDEVYGELNCCAQCCCCHPLAEKVIQEAELKFVAMDDIVPMQMSA